MNRLTKQHCETAGETESRKLYIPDLVHLSRDGADCYAGLLANEGKTLIIDKNKSIDRQKPEKEGGL
jgi:hypothetical protein